jgi:endonuclease G, mitochondrial
MKRLLYTFILALGLLLSCEKVAVNPYPSTLSDYYPKGQTNQIIKHKYYTLSYSEPDEQAEWVAYLLTSKMPSV